jgi:formylglycine-generating enzyme required for sulfatase activity
VTAGVPFNRSNDPAAPAKISNFRLDNYEITVGRLRRFVAAYSQTPNPSTIIPAGAGKNPNNPNDPGWDTLWNSSLPANATALTTGLNCNASYQSWTDAEGTAVHENLPANCLTWFVAQAFCIWDGGRLPTEAEWDYAAEGGQAQRGLPWGGTALSCDYANYKGRNGNMDYCTAPGLGAVNPVGTESPLGNGLYGQSDLAGNVWEWNQDWFAPYTSTCNNCANLTAGGERVLHGGSFGSDLGLQPNFVRYHDNISIPYYAFGARCARNL